MRGNKLLRRKRSGHDRLLLDVFSHSPDECVLQRLTIAILGQFLDLHPTESSFNGKMQILGMSVAISTSPSFPRCE